MATHSLYLGGHNVSFRTMAWGGMEFRLVGALSWGFTRDQRRIYAVFIASSNLNGVPFGLVLLLVGHVSYDRDRLDTVSREFSRRFCDDSGFIPVFGALGKRADGRGICLPRIPRLVSGSQYAGTQVPDF